MINPRLPLPSSTGPMCLAPTTAIYVCPGKEWLRYCLFSLSNDVHPKRVTVRPLCGIFIWIFLFRGHPFLNEKEKNPVFHLDQNVLSCFVRWRHTAFNIGRCVEGECRYGLILKDTFKSSVKNYIDFATFDLCLSVEKITYGKFAYCGLILMDWKRRKKYIMFWLLFVYCHR